MPRTVYEILLPTKWKKIALDGELSPDNGVDTDKDTLTDWEEVNVDELIKLSNGNYTLPKVTLKSLLETLKRYDNDEYFFITGNTLPIYYLPILSDPTEPDTDGDGLNDSIDNKKFIPADSRFSPCVSEDYLTIPPNDFVIERMEASNASYKSLTKSQVINELNSLTVGTVSKVLVTAAVAFITDPQVGMADFGASTIFSDLCCKILIGMNGDNTINSGYLVHSSRALENYFLGLGIPFHYDAMDMSELILSSRNNIDHMVYNITKAMQYAEQVGISDESVYFTTNSNAGLKVTCFDDKGKNCNITKQEDIKKNDHHMGTYFNSKHVDWHVTIGESFGGIRAEVTRVGDTYTMKYRYCLNDIYEWTEEPGKSDIGNVLHPFHKAGYAKQFLLDGYWEGTITWKDGQGAYDKNVYNQIIETLRNNIGLYYESYDMSDEYLDACYRLDENKPEFNYRKIY